MAQFLIPGTGTIVNETASSNQYLIPGISVILNETTTAGTGFQPAWAANVTHIPK